MTIELKPEQEQIIRQQLASGLYGSVEEVLDTALANLPNDVRFDREHRREAVRRMIEFGERRKLSLGEPVTREILHEMTTGHFVARTLDPFLDFCGSWGRQFWRQPPFQGGFGGNTTSAG